VLGYKDKVWHGGTAPDTTELAAKPVSTVVPCSSGGVSGVTRAEGV